MDIITNSNVNFVRQQIIEKNNQDVAYFGRIDTAKNVITDMDNFPYQRFYRGVYNSARPIVFEREAGWRPISDKCYKGLLDYRQPDYPSHCFETACSTVNPCIPEYMRKYADSRALAVFLDRLCVDKSP